MGVLTGALWGVVVGVALQLQQAQLWPAWAYAVSMLGAAVVVGLAGRCRPGLGKALLWTLAMACAAAGFTGWRAVLYSQEALSPELQGQDLELVGHVSGLPRNGPRGTQFEFAVEAARWKGQEVKVPPTVQLGWNVPWTGGGGSEAEEGPWRPGGPPRVQTGERWRLTARLHRPHGLSNPHGFDVELWMWEQGLQASGTVRAGRKHPAPVPLPGRAWAPVDAARQSVRDAIFRQLPDARAAGVLAALVVGDQASIDSLDWNVFRITGVAHAVAISGLHITMFSVLAVGLVGALWRGCARQWPALLYRVPTPTAAAIGGVLLAALYALVAGWGVPSQRTVLMLAVVTVLRLSARRWPWPQVWLSAMVAVLLFDPWALMQPGFWLSFVAVGVLFATSGSYALAPRGLRERCAELLRTQSVVTVALAPLTLMLFGQFSLIGWVANLLVIPWVTWVVTPLAMAGVLFAPLWRLGEWAVQGMALVLERLAALPWAALERPALPWGLGALAVAGGVLLVWRLPWSWRVWGLLWAWPALAYTPPRPPPGGFELLAPDVGQGSAILVRTARHTLLHDTGPRQGASSAAQRVLLPLLRAQGERLDTVVVSHDDSDHAAGLPVLARAFPRADLLASFDTLPATARTATRCEAGQAWEWDGVRFQVLHPRAEDYGAGWQDNAMSCVLKVTAAGADGPRVALLTGDISAREEARLAQEHPDLKADVLVAAHHGSKTSTSASWLDLLEPRQVVIQSGYRNRYGHPAPTVLARLEERAIAWVNSPSCGAARWRSDKPEVLDCHRLQHRRYWHTP